MFDFGFQIPVIFVLLCFTLGTSVFYGLAHWCVVVQKGSYEGQGISSIISKWLLRGMIIVLFFPIFVKFYTIGQSDPDFSIASEVSALILIFTAFMFYQYRRNHLMPRQLLEKTAFEGIKHLQLFLSIIVIWGISACLGLAVYLMSAKAALFLPVFDPPRDTAMVVTGAWLLPFIILYQKIIKQSEAGQIKTPDHFKFYMLLGPILLGMLLFMVPLMVEKYIHSDKFHDMMNRKPPLERV